MMAPSKGHPMSLATLAMPKEPKRPKDSAHPPKKRMGRPKGAGRITTRYAIVATPEYRVWMKEFVTHLGEPEISDVFREAIRLYADAKGFRPPPKR
jgi:hypothetical protein